MNQERFQTLLKTVRVKDPKWILPDTLLALDPGETTGWAFFKRGILTDADQLLTSAEPYKTIQDFIVEMRPTHVVCEDYKVYGHKVKEHSWSSLHTPRLIGGIQMLCMQMGITPAFQMAGLAKGFCTDEKLKKWGMWQTGKRHARDAIRHGCYYLLLNKG